MNCYTNCQLALYHHKEVNRKPKLSKPRLLNVSKNETKPSVWTGGAADLNTHVLVQCSQVDPMFVIN